MATETATPKGVPRTEAFVPVYERDLTIVSGKGARLRDGEGREYLDFAAGVGVNGLGYGDSKVTAAIRRQAGVLVHASNLYHSEPAADLAERLSRLAFPAKVFFCNSGTEGTEACIKFARRVGNPKGKTKLVAFERAFHGRTMGALSLTWTAKYREPFEPLIPGVTFCPVGDVAAAEAAIDDKTAAVVIEPVQGEGGVRVVPFEFLQALRRICDAKGALLLFDEVQSGLGRTGKLFAHQHAGVVPDMMWLAKPLGGGLPLGAVLVKQELAMAMQVGDHGSTFGGNPVACAAAHAVLDRLSPTFVADVARKGERLRDGILTLGKKNPQIKEVRGLGLMLGIELAGPAAPVVKGLRERGVLATKAGDTVLRLLPPLVLTRKDVAQFLTALEAVLQSGAGAV